jgi:hypothetical protein
MARRPDTPCVTKVTWVRGVLGPAVADQDVS